jgi:hypothetical protein
MGNNDNRHWTDPNQNNTSRKLGIPIENATARAFNDITAPGILPASGPMRTTPSAVFGGSDGKGNRTSK